MMSFYYADLLAATAEESNTISAESELTGENCDIAGIHFGSAYVDWP